MPDVPAGGGRGVPAYEPVGLVVEHPGGDGRLDQLELGHVIVRLLQEVVQHSLPDLLPAVVAVDLEHV